MARPVSNSKPDSAAAPQARVEPRRGGRVKAFEGETVKVALFLPPDLAGDLKAFAAKRHQTPSLLVAEWIRVAEVREAIAKGRQSFEAEDVVSHEDAIQRLSRW